jgi:hypothetical protein
MTSQKYASATVDGREVRRICGDLPDEKVAALVASGASIGDLEKAAAWLASREAAGNDRILPEGRIAELCDILASGEDDLFGEEER